MLTLKLAIRNLLRNTRRTLLTAILISFSLTALILVDALMLGMLDILVNSITKNLVGEAQIHRVGFRDNFDVDLYLSEADEISETLDQDPTVAAYSERVLAGGMLSSSYNVATGLMYGINAASEGQVTQLPDAVIEGQYLTGKSGEILIGDELADLLEVGLGDRIVITLSEADTGELAQALFRVSGIFKFGIKGVDKGVVFTNLDQARGVIGLTNEQSHEFALRFTDRALATRPDTAVYQNLNTPELETLNWLQLNKPIASIIEMSGFASLIIGTILFILAGLGVINSMFMSIYERIYEFGVIKALGTRPARLAGLIMTEALLIALISCLAGLVLAYLLGTYTSVHGVPMGEYQISGIAIDNRILTRLEPYQFIQFPIYVIFLTLVAAIYPARFAARIVPTEALQRSL
ncbi:MAG: ABC-type lipoprotein release transport system permease subunit [Candidatus Azotimanducaceae bacterium]|jgi:putative ABC transport system permease protein